MIRARLPAALLVALAVAVHAPMLGHGFTFDDGVQIYKNPAVTDGVPLWRYFLDRETGSQRAEYNARIYRPLRNLSLRLVTVIGGVRPVAYGLANLALYAIAALLVLALLRQLVSDERAALWATAVWVVLPVHVEAVQYYSALGDLQSLALELGAVLVALPLIAGERRRWRLAASAALAAASMLTKEMAVTEPAMLVLVAVALGGDAWRGRGLRVVFIVHTLVAVAYLALRTAVVRAVGQDPVTVATLHDGLRDAPWLLAHYVWLTVAPLGHSAAYRVTPPSVAWWLVTVAALAAVAVATWRWRRTAAVGLAWFAVSLLPVLHLVPLWTDLADRFALFPSVGAAIVLAAALAPLRRRIVIVALAVVVAIYAAATVVEARAWRSDALLWRYAVDRQPQAPLAHNNLAAVLLGEGRIAEAAAELDTLHALGYTRPNIELLRMYLLPRVGRPTDAMFAMASALRLDPDNGVVHALAGQLALAGGATETAAKELMTARRLAPAHPSTALLGYLVLRARGELAPEDARVDYLQALQALVFDDAAGAVHAARDCLRRSPGRAQCEAALGQALVLRGPLSDEARALLDRCIAGAPDPADRRRCREAKWGAR